MNKSYFSSNRFYLVIFIVMSNFANASQINNTNNNILLFSLGIIIVAAAIAGISTKFAQPVVLGQILAGSLVAILAHYKIGIFDKITTDPTLAFLAELGSIFLLFEIGLESKVKEIYSTGKSSFFVALIGVIVPFLFGYYIVTPLIATTYTSSLAAFIGSTLAVTSTSISVSVLKDLGIIKHKIGHILLTASIIDDIFGLILLSIIPELILVGHINLYTFIRTFSSIGIFFFFSTVFALSLLPKIIIPISSKISNHNNMLVLILVGYSIFMSWFAGFMNLAPIIGAFIAGLFLEEKIFDRYYTHLKYPVSANTQDMPSQNYLVEQISPFGKVFIPIFFIFAGMQVDLIACFNWYTIKTTLIITLFAIAGKSICGIFLPKDVNRWIVGFGMVPRGEFGIIFALSGLELKIINKEIFAAILMMVILTSIITPITLNLLARRNLNQPHKKFSK